MSRVACSTVLHLDLNVVVSILSLVNITANNNQISVRLIRYCYDTNNDVPRYRLGQHLPCSPWLWGRSETPGLRVVSDRLRLDQLHPSQHRSIAHSSRVEKTENCMGRRRRHQRPPLHMQHLYTHILGPEISGPTSGECPQAGSLSVLHVRSDL